MADQMKATPRSPILGLFSDIVNLPLQYMSAPQRTQQMQGAAEFLYGTGIPKTLERMSYGDSLFSGSGMTLRPKEETINAAMNVAPFAPAVGRLASRAVRATEGMPVGMSIKSVGDDIFNLSKQEFLGKPRITKNANAADLKPIELTTLKDVEPQPFMGGKYQIKMNEDGAVVLDKGKPIASYNFGDTLVVDKPYRKSGLAQELVYEWRTSFPAPAVAKERTKASQAIQEKVWERIQNEKQSLPEQSPYPQQAALPVKPPTDDVYEVMDATFNYGKLGGNKTIPIDQLTGGVRMSDPTEARRVKELADKISSPEGYISRIIIDDSGNVLEGQHRLEALRLLGEKNVPVAVIEDLSNKYDISAMENAIQGKFRSDQSNQLIRQAIDTLEEAGSVEKALSDYSMPPMFQQPFQDAIRASQKVTPTQIESPAFTDPFANTIGSSIR
jgi:hypothetical protein